MVDTHVIMFDMLNNFKIYIRLTISVSMCMYMTWFVMLPWILNEIKYKSIMYHCEICKSKDFFLAYSIFVFEVLAESWS